MANEQLKPIASLLLFLNFSMYVIVTALGGWAINIAINRGFIIGPELKLPAHFTPLFFPIGNFATGFFVMFALVAGAVGAASSIAGLNHIRFWNYESLQPAVSSAITAWLLTLLAMGLACKEIDLEGRNAKLGHIIPFLDLAHYLSLRRPRLSLTVVVTPTNVPLLDHFLAATPSASPVDRLCQACKPSPSCTDYTLRLLPSLYSCSL
ncbi:hypothetical protein Cni_G05996 [Canna indica]|uniref:Uncharacterized protein n=1 Tax=Canna indica TaxID=4628 RepID=A0AAQ3JXQ9_9LILI|nr:hypothetical protein Cni_G05996 [Canna indica]